MAEDVPISSLYKALEFIDRYIENGYPQSIERKRVPKALLAAFCCRPMTHENAQLNAKKLYVDKGFSGVFPPKSRIVPPPVSVIDYLLKNRAPRGSAPTKSGEAKTLGPFFPSCVDHGRKAELCDKTCQFGMKLKKRWVHELIELPSNGSRGPNIEDLGFETRKSAAEKEHSDLIEDAYFRERGASLEKIEKKHSRMSNQFVNWLKANRFSSIVREVNFVDVAFGRDDVTYLAEIKICPRQDSRHGIREALGQLLEYNYYPGRRPPAHCWVIILDCEASSEDLRYLRRLKSRFGLPVCLGWRVGKSFSFAK